jgi:tetratricopeptide (TPR) repeat protein
MLLGADFLLSHRVYVANSEHRLYFTYNGGPVFVPERGVILPPKGAAPAPPVVPGETPVDADGFARRAAAFDARGDFPAAIADLNQLVSMQPTAAHYLQRAIEHRRNGDADAELADLDATLNLEPANATALMARGVLELRRGDQAAGIADLSAPIKAYIERSGGPANDPRITPLGRLTVTLGWWAFLHRDDANFPEAMNAVCWGHAFWGKELSMGQQRCAIAMDRSPGDGDLHDARGLIDLRFGDDQGATTEFNAVLDHNPKDAWALFGRGMAELDLGKATEGHTDMAAAAALSPGLADVAKGYGITP